MTIVPAVAERGRTSDAQRAIDGLKLHGRVAVFYYVVYAIQREIWLSVSQVYATLADARFSIVRFGPARRHDELEHAMSFFYALAAGFLLFTVLMVAFFVFMGVLNWRDERSK